MKDTTETKEFTLNIQPLLMPLSILLSTLIFTTGFVIGMNTLATGLKGGIVTTGTGTTTTGNTGTTTAGATTVTKDTVKALFEDNTNLTFGNKDSKVLFVMFSDPSCPYCHIAAGLNPNLNTSAGPQFTMVADGGTYVAPVEEMRKLVDAGQAGFAWLYTNGHGNGEMGTKAMYCADEQDKFWAVHDLLMSEEGYTIVNDVVKNNKAKSQDMANFLSGVIDSNFMKSCLESGKYDSRISTDTQISSSFGVSGTPGFFVNETNYAGAYSYTDMAAAVEGALAQ